MRAGPSGKVTFWWTAAVVAAAVVGLGLMLDSLWRSSATYDEVAYLKVAARWWRTGDEEAITRMGSPLTFWKVQQAPALWAFDRFGDREVVDHPIGNQAVLLPWVRAWSLSLWLVAFGLTSYWARLMHGPRAMAAAAWLFALSPNLLAHGALVTMELPLTACTTGVFLLFWRSLRTGRSSFFWASAALSGLAFSCKFTAVLLPPLLALAWGDERRRRRERVIGPVFRGMVAFTIAMAVSNLVVTGFATLPLSERAGSHPFVEGKLGSRFERIAARVVEAPLPQDWVGFVTQMRHQSTGGSSYLFGQRRAYGWRYYYVVALAVKVPLAFWLMIVARGVQAGRKGWDDDDRFLLTVVLAFVAVASLGSSRNYGIRYLLPVAPLAIVWLSGLAEGGRWSRGVLGAGLVGYVVAVASIHPYELSYFNRLAGGTSGGKRILADSCLDWGQGAKLLAKLQARRPEFRDLTLYYFGDTDPGNYGVVGRRYVIDAGSVHPDLPPKFSAETRYVAVSTSLQFGPWGPAGYFQGLEGVDPVLTLEDGTIAIYENRR